MSTTVVTQDVEVGRRIQNLLEDLPPESLSAVEYFIRFVRHQPNFFNEPYYPTVLVPAPRLDTWSNILPVGYEGDALKDTEALYDEVY